ncbi:DUF3137 domain-containing protein [Candidatus Micrarchaeota archaeon]|nr:DUF3137 domain-containing protein [Candidatus Micrarchaeota archaeon]
MNDAKFEEIISRMQGDLILLEDERKKVKNKLIVLICAILLIFIFILLTINFDLILFAGIIGFGAYAIGSGMIKGKYVSAFKRNVIAKIIASYNPLFEYLPTSGIGAAEFNSSKIFQTIPNIYSSEDMIKGTAGKTKMVFSEIDAKKETGSGKHRKVTPIFHGLFFIADFNKNFKTPTFVFPDSGSSFFGNLISDFLQATNIAKSQLVKLEDPEFEKYFTVYCADQIEARYILSPSLMQRIVEFRKKVGKEVLISFINSDINIAIRMNENYFEPTIWSPLDKNQIKQYFDQLELVFGIVEDLDLNERIWAKK